MKRIAACLLSLLFILMSGCKKDNNNPGNPDDGFSLLTEMEIGPTGGQLYSEGTLILDIPPGSFTSNINLQLYSSKEENPYGEDGGVSEVIYIKGLPSDFYKSIRVAVKYDGVLSSDSYIGWGFQAYSTSNFDTLYAYRLVPGTDSSGYLVGMLLPPGKGSRETAGEDHSHQGKYGTPFMCVTGQKYYLTDHFMILFHERYYNLNAIPSLAGGLEDAYDLLKSWGFKYDARTEWPVEVRVKPIKEETAENPVDGQSLREGFIQSNNTGYLEINNRIIEDLTRLRITGGHEFFHLVQDLYNADEKYNWLQEASSTWFEAYLTNDPDGYVPGTYITNKIQPFYGLQKGSEKKAGDHGYGCSSVMKYQMSVNNQSGNPNAIVKVWEAAKNGVPPVEAIQAFPMNSVNWWPGYIKSAFEGKIFKDTVYTLFNNIYFGKHGGSFTIAGESDKEKSFQSDGLDWSGEVFEVEPTYSGLTGNSSLVITRTNGIRSYAYIFRFNRATKNLTLLGETSAGFTVSNLKDYADKKDRIYIVFAHWGSTPPGYTGTTPLTVTFKVEQNPGVTHYEVQADNIYPYFSGSFSISIVTDNNYPFSVVFDGYYNPEQNHKEKQMTLCFNAPPAGQEVVFNIYIDTLGLSSSNGAKPILIGANYLISDATQNPFLLHPTPNELPYHLVAKFSNSIAAGYCSYWLDIQTQNPFLENSLGVLMIDFNTGDCNKCAD